MLDLLARAVLESPADAIVAADREGMIVFWNPGAERLFGHGQDEAVGRSLDMIIPESLRARHWRGYRRVMATGTSRYAAGDVLAVPGIRKDGSRISLEFTIVPLTGEGEELAGLVAIMRDVTRRFEEMKALRNRLAHLGATAHETG